MPTATHLKARVRAHLELSLEPRAKGPQRERETNPNTRAIRHESSLLVHTPAFLQSDIDAEIIMELPSGTYRPADEGG